MSYSHPPPASVLTVPSLAEQFLLTASWLRPHMYPERWQRIACDCQDSQGKWLSAELTVLASDYFPSVVLRDDGQDWECRVRAHFIGWDERWDEEIDVVQQPFRLAQPGTAAFCSSAWHPLWWHRPGERVMCWYATPRYPTAGDWLEGRIKRLDQHQAHVVLVNNSGRHISRWYRLDQDCVLSRGDYDVARQVWSEARRRQKAETTNRRSMEDERLRVQRANVASAEILSYRQQMELQAAREREKQRRRASTSATATSTLRPTSPTHYTYADPLPAALQQAEKSRSRSLISSSTSPSHNSAYAPQTSTSPTSHHSRSAAASIISASTAPSNTFVSMATPASVTRSHSISSSSTQSQASRTSSSISSTYAAPATSSSATATSTSSSSAAPPFFIGQFVEARDVMDDWLPATITRIDTENNRVLVHFEGWASKYDEWITYLPLSPPSTPSSPSPTPSPSSSSHSFPVSARLRPLGSSLLPSNEEIQRAQIEKAFRFAVSAAGYELIEQEGDGNCLYRCFAYVLYGSADEHRRVRDECMSYIESECEYYARFVGESIGEYVKRGRRENEWGDHVEIEAMKELYDVNVLVLAAPSKPSSDDGLELDVKGEELSGLRTVRLSYHGQSHYNCLVTAADKARLPLIGKDRGIGEVRGVWRARRMQREKAESEQRVGVKDERKEGGEKMKLEDVSEKVEPMLEAQKVLIQPTMRLSH